VIEAGWGQPLDPEPPAPPFEGLTTDKADPGRGSHPFGNSYRRDQMISKRIACHVHAMASLGRAALWSPAFGACNVPDGRLGPLMWWAPVPRRVT